MSWLSNQLGHNADLFNGNNPTDRMGNWFQDKFGQIFNPNQQALVPPGPPNPEMVARAKYQKDKEALAKKQRGLTDQFRKQMPGMQQGLYSEIEGQAKRDLMDAQRKISRQAKSRGLLYSGLRVGDQARVGSQIASQTAQKKSQVAPELQRLASSLEQEAARTAQTNFQGDLGIARSTYDTALRDARERAAALSGLLETGGTIAGAYFGSKNADADRYERQKRLYSVGLDADGGFY